MNQGDPNGWQRVWAEESSKRSGPSFGDRVIRFVLSFLVAWIVLDLTLGHLLREFLT